MSQNNTKNESSSPGGYQGDFRPSTSRMLRRQVESTMKRGLTEAEVQLLIRVNGKDYFKAKKARREG